MLLMYHNIRCQCGYISDNIDDFDVIDDSPFCIDCLRDNNVVRICGGCKCQSADFDYIKDYEVSDFETAYLCPNCWMEY